MLSNIEVAGFLNQVYLKKKLMNQLDFWHDDKDSRSIEDGLYIFSWFSSKELSANQISGLLNQFYLKANWVNQCEFLEMMI